MKDFVKMIRSFILFDLPLQVSVISNQFATTHESYQKQLAHWNFKATRRKLIANFWLRLVIYHYLVILGLAAIIILPFTPNWNGFLLSVFLGGIICLVTLILFHYGPTYYSEFLPKLDTIIAEQESLRVIQEETRKCKRSQFSIPTLTIIFYVFSKASNTPLLPSNDRSAELLNCLYGADKDKLKQNLSRLYKVSKLSPKERAEMQKGVDASRIFFEAVSLTQAQNILNQLELKIHQTP
jgi:hypothetical protein